METPPLVFASAAQVERQTEVVAGPMNMEEGLQVSAGRRLKMIRTPPPPPPGTRALKAGSSTDTVHHGIGGGGDLESGGTFTLRNLQMCDLSAAVLQFVFKR